MSTNQTNQKARLLRFRRLQRGAALPLVAVGLLTMMAFVGLALDTSHALVNKTRLQNTVDAAALAAAKAYDETLDIFEGNTAATSLFGLNADGAGNHELNAAYDSSEINVLIQWSETLDPFVSTGIGPYVRVVATDYELDTSLSAILGILDIEISASAVAGPSPSITTACNIAPMVVCAMDPDDPNLFGFTAGQLDVLKSSSNTSEIGPGNFQLIRLDCGAGGACVRENLAGDYNGCATRDETVETEPGNTVGPTVQGLNTRFGDFSGPMSSDDYHPDVVTTQPVPPVEYDPDTDTITQDGVVVDESMIYSYDDYVTNIENDQLTYDPPFGVYGRRVLALPVARCDGTSTGQSTLDVVGFGCYFLIQQVVQKGTEANIFGQFIEGCKAGGSAGMNPGAGPEPYLIQLYKDANSVDS
jgi:hypothetical protein